MKIGIIGFGHLGKAFANGLLSQKIAVAEDISVCARSSQTLGIARKSYGFFASSDINAVMSRSEIIFWIVKVSALNEILQSANRELLSGLEHVSFMANLSSEQFCELSGCRKVIIAMPSIAIADGQGVIGYTPTSNMFIKDMFSRLGTSIELAECDIEKIIAFASCGLGFAAYILESFVKAGICLGFERKTSENIVTQTFLNALSMSNFSDTVAAVATKGGITECGVNFLREHDADGVINGAISAAYIRAKQK